MHYSLPQRIGDAIRDQALWNAGDRVAVAVSGGVDSVVLLHALVETASWHKARLSVVTVDHGTRPDSAADADFVERLAAALGVPCERVARSLGPSASEAVCRDARLEAFAGLEVDVVALAHHADDQAETMLLHLLRGTGTKGLAAMQPRNDRLVRPMLGLRRSEIEAWAASHEPPLSWREDPTNRDPRFLRNRVRNEVLPLLEDLRPGAVAALARSARVAALDDAWIEAAVPTLPEPGRPVLVDVLAPLPEAVLRRALLRWAAPVQAAHIDALVKAVYAERGRVELPGGRTVAVQRLNDDGAVYMVEIGS